MAAILGFGRDDILAAVQDMYAAVAARPSAPYHFPVGAAACRAAGYPPELLGGVPPAALESFAGVGCPFHAGLIRPGDRVLDVGCGSGTDAFVAAGLVGPTGKVYALDMTPAMLAKLRGLVAAGGANIEVLEGNAEQLPLPDASVDVVTSNGVLNLVPDKRRAVREMFRVLKPGGRAQIADIVIAGPVTPDCTGDPSLWAECVVGASVDAAYLELFRDAGFDDVRLLREHDYFAHSRSRQTQDVARRFGARAVELAMRRGARAPSKALQWARRLDPRRLAAAASRRGLAGAAALALALLTCYGTLAALALLSVLGITLAVNEAAVGVAVALLAALAAAAVGAGRRKHGSPWPLVPAGAGAALVAFAMLVAYDWRTELAGFVLLLIAVAWDFRRRRRADRRVDRVAGSATPPV